MTDDVQKTTAGVLLPAAVAHAALYPDLPQRPAPGERCGTCYSLKRGARLVIDQHCNDSVSPWPQEWVGETWWCCMWEARK